MSNRNDFNSVMFNKKQYRLRKFKVVMGKGFIYSRRDGNSIRNPLNPKEVYTSKSKLRQRYKEAGVTEVGDA